jgi:glycerol-3-phosphate acyltransferase PlsY
MNVWWVLLAAASGYLLGSLSISRIMLRLFAPGGERRTLYRAIGDGDTSFSSSSISATVVREQLGARYGCLTAILDACKAAIPALAFRLLWPGEPYDLIAATAAIVGHNYPIYHGFRGGRGLSTVYGGFFVLDWVGVIVTALLGSAAGILLEQVVLVRWLGMMLMIPWIWFRTRDLSKLLYVLAANALFWVAMLPELRQMVSFIRAGTMPDSSEVADLMGMGTVWQAVRRYSIPSLLRRLRGSERDTIQRRKDRD